MSNFKNRKVSTFTKEKALKYLLDNYCRKEPCISTCRFDGEQFIGEDDRPFGYNVKGLRGYRIITKPCHHKLSHIDKSELYWETAWDVYENGVVIQWPC